MFPAEAVAVSVRRGQKDRHGHPPLPHPNLVSWQGLGSTEGVPAVTVATLGYDIYESDWDQCVLEGF